VDVRPPAGEELAAEADVVAGSAYQVGHESVARDQAAAGEGDGERTEVGEIARAASSLREAGLEKVDEMPLDRSLTRPGTVGETKPA
jgi:hypothetical protein